VLGGLAPGLLLCSGVACRIFCMMLQSFDGRSLAKLLVPHDLGLSGIMPAGTAWNQLPIASHTGRSGCCWIGPTASCMSAVCSCK
jgi:hypothetical protein